MAPGPSAVMVWRADHTGRLLDFVIDHPLYAMWYLMVHRGPRRGEVCGLEWSDCSLRARYSVVTIERRSSGSGGSSSRTPKSDAGGREIALGMEGTAVLRAQRVRQSEHRLGWGEAWLDSGKVFTQADGSVLNPDWVSDEFERIWRAAGLPMIRLHDLRHGAAMLMLARAWT